MKSKKLIDALENVNEEYIEEAQMNNTKKKKPKILILAACLALVLVCGAAAYGFSDKPDAEPENTEGSFLKTNVAKSEDEAAEKNANTEKTTARTDKRRDDDTAAAKDKETTDKKNTNKMQSIAPRVLYNDSEYIICGVAGEGEILTRCGLDEPIDESYAGDRICTLETEDGTVWTVVEDEGATVVYEYSPSNKRAAVLYEYSPQPNGNVYILLLDGTYYAAIKYDNGYRSVNDD